MSCCDVNEFMMVTALRESKGVRERERNEMKAIREIETEREGDREIHILTNLVCCLARPVLYHGVECDVSDSKEVRRQ